MWDEGIAAQTPPIRATQTGDGGSGWGAFGAGIFDTVGKLYSIKKQAEILKSGNPNAYALADQYATLNQPLVDNQTAALALQRQRALQEQAAQSSNLKTYLMIGAAALVGLVVLKKVL